MTPGEFKQDDEKLAHTYDTSVTTVALMKSELFIELKNTMEDLIESRFKELEAIVQARLSIMEQRNSTGEMMPLSVSSELCIKGTTSGAFNMPPLTKLEMSQTEKVLRHNSKKPPVEEKKLTQLVMKKQTSNSDSREIYMPSFRLGMTNPNNSLFATQMLGEDFLVIKDVTPSMAQQIEQQNNGGVTQRDSGLPEVEMMMAEDVMEIDAGEMDTSPGGFVQRVNRVLDFNKSVTGCLPSDTLPKKPNTSTLASLLGVGVEKNMPNITLNESNQVQPKKSMP